MRNSVRNAFMTALIVFMATVGTSFVNAEEQSGESSSPLDGLTFNDCSVVCDELHYSDACHAYRVENPCPTVDTNMISAADQ